ncbi:hypothetical protein GN958_ATG14570, partial [Phytophthora infestans]
SGTIRENGQIAHSGDRVSLLQGFPKPNQPCRMAQHVTQSAQGSSESLTVPATTDDTRARDMTTIDEDLKALFRIRYKELAKHFKKTTNTKRIIYVWVALASTLSVQWSKMFTDQQCQIKGRTGNCGPIRRPKHYLIMKDSWGDTTGMNNRPHLITEDMDTPPIYRAGEWVEADLGAVAKGFSEGLAIQSDRAHAQALQLLKQIETQSEQLREQNQNMRELLNLIRHRN